MRNKTALFTLTAVLLLLGWGCRKDVVEIRPYPDTLKELSLFLKQVPDQGMSTTYHFNGLNEDEVLTLPTGGRLLLTDVDHLFVRSGTTTPVAASTCSDLKIEVVIVKSKGDILARGLSTVTTEEELLLTGGMVMVKAFCGSDPLDLAPDREIKVQLPDSAPSDNMLVYSADFSAQKYMTWKITGQEVYKAEWPAPGGTGIVEGYELILNSLGWFNCARPISNTATSPFCTSLQPSFTALNTKAYLVFDHFPVVIPLNFDDTSHSFCFPNAPAGYPVSVISVGKTDADYYLGNISTETGTNTHLALTPEVTSAALVLGYLRGL